MQQSPSYQCKNIKWLQITENCLIFDLALLFADSGTGHLHVIGTNWNAPFVFPWNSCFL